MSAKVTVVIPTKDRPSMLSRSVRSALTAARSIDEIVVVDDASCTPAETALASIRDPRMRVIKSTGFGAAAARNTGIAAATGTHILFLDDDDELLPEYVVYVTDQVLTQPCRPKFGYSAVIFQDQLRGRRLRPPSRPGIYTPPRKFERRLHGFGMGFWAVKEVFAELGPIDENLPTNEDTEFFLRLQQSEFTGWFSASPGVVVHRHTGHIGELEHLTDRTSAARRLMAFREIASRHASLVKQDLELRRFLQRKLIRLALRSGNAGLAREEIRYSDLSTWAYFWLHTAAYRLRRRKSE